MTSDLFQDDAEAGMGLMAQMMQHGAGALEFRHIDGHAVPCALRHCQIEHVLRQAVLLIDLNIQNRRSTGFTFCWPDR
jgi:hypothetical protein